MNIKLTLLSAIMLVMVGCATTTTITDPELSGPVVIKSKSDSMVTYNKEKGEVTVDNRGRPNIFESILGYGLSKTSAEVN